MSSAQWQQLYKEYQEAGGGNYSYVGGTSFSSHTSSSKSRIGFGGFNFGF